MTSSINSILSNATSGLRAAQAGISVVSDNITNANVAGYTAKTQQVTSFLVGNQTSGVRTGLVARTVDDAVQASVWSQASRVGALNVRSQVLTAINTTQGVPGDGTSITDGVTALQNSFNQLQAQPADAASQAAVVAAATTLAQRINDTANTIATQRNGVQAQISSSVDSLNQALATVASATHDIINAKADNQDTAALEDKRDQALQTISGLVDVHYDKQPNGDITILGRSGFTIPLDATFSTAAATLAPQSTLASGTIPPILMHSSNPAAAPVDVTARLQGGSLGELVQLRDTTLPSYTASLDAFSSKLGSQFSSQGLQLFSDGTASVAPATYTGLSSLITVNPAVTAAPAKVRDGTSGTPFTPNPASGPAGYSALITRVLGNTFAAPSGSTSLAADAGAFVVRQSRDTAAASTDLGQATTLQTSLAARFTAGSGVDVDHEMGLLIQLQNSYQANARVIQTAQSLFNSLLSATNAA